MPQPYFEMEESRSVTPWVNRLYFESPRASSFLGLRLVKTRHKNLVPLLSGVKPDPVVGSGRYAEPIPVKSPLGLYRCSSISHKQHERHTKDTRDVIATNVPLILRNPPIRLSRAMIGLLNICVTLIDWYFIPNKHKYILQNKIT